MNSPVKPMSVDAIKRRTRAGMGRCQGGFCQPTVVGLLAKERGVDWTEVDFKKKGTKVVLANNREID
jgi:glycerol-3-phosphate dehydrogenase